MAPTEELKSREGLEASPSDGALPSAARVRADALADLARRGLAGCHSALHELLSKLAPHLRKVIRETLGAAGDVEDVLQESLVAVTHALPTFRWDCTVLHFAIRIAIRCSLNARRRWYSIRQRSDKLALLETPLLATDASFGELDLASRRIDALRGLLGKLPPGQAHSLALHAVMEYSPKEIAEATGVPVNTVRSRIRLAREAMRRHIEDNSTLIELLGPSD
jgi:RNA polymerase sigma-70 factor (ECF subfamily)